VRDHQGTAGCQPLGVPAHQSERIVAVRDEVQYGGEDQRDRPVEVDQPAGVLRLQDLPGLVQVALEDGSPGFVGEQCPAVRYGHRVDVDVDDPAVRVGGEGHVVHVALGRDAGADVEELPYAERGQLAYRAAQEGAVGLEGGREVRVAGRDLAGEFPVRREVVGAADPVVVDPGDARGVDVDLGRGPGGAFGGARCGSGVLTFHGCLLQ
jgi:hypothetical protein